MGEGGEGGGGVSSRSESSESLSSGLKLSLLGLGRGGEESLGWLERVLVDSLARVKEIGEPAFD
jgi:hypothetical protein